MRINFLGVSLLLTAVVSAFTATTMAETAPQTLLPQLMANRFGKLSLAEERLANAAAKGEMADCMGLSGDDKNIRGDLLSWLCTDPQATAQLTYRGIFMSGAEIVNEVDLAWAKIPFPIVVSDCVFREAVNLKFSRVAFLVLTGSSLKILDMGGAHFEGSVYLNYRFKAERGVNLTGAKIDGNLVCEGGQFIGDDKVPALDLTNATIGGYLACDGGQFIGNDKVPALSANNTEVKGSVFLLDGFKAEGGVDLTGARIDGNLECDGGQFIGNDKVPALKANSTEVKGSVFLRYGFKAEGEVSFLIARIDRNFECYGSRFIGKGEVPALDLRRTKVGTLLNSEDSWPTQGNLRVDGFVYDEIAASPSAKVQLSWLQLQRRDRFLSQPFEQLAAVFRKMGLDEDARAVMIAKNEEHAHYVQWRPEWLWYGLFGHLIGYGYSPWRAFFISLGVIGLGWWLFRRGYRRGLVTPTNTGEYTVEKDGAQASSDDYPKFNAFIYSLETFVPLVKLGIGDHWMPNANRNALGNQKRLRFPPKTGGWLRGYLWFHIIAGWVLTTLWVGGITGLVKT